MSSSENNSALAQVKADVLRRPDQGNSYWTIGILERVLLDRFPREDAESWDRMGLMVGDPHERVSGIAVALDPTVEAVRNAAAHGANVLLTHHPVFIDPPTSFRPLGDGFFGPGSVVWEAISRGVALMNFHTSLDVSVEAARMLPSMLGLDFHSIVEPVTATGLGYGQLSYVTKEDKPLSLRNLSARCLSVFGRPGRIWGDPDKRIETVVTATGSAGGLVELCAQQGVDCLICGETRYHNVLAASEAGLCVIELGHDVSELPLCAVLATTVASLGYPENEITILDQSTNWHTPEAVRK